MVHSDPDTQREDVLQLLALLEDSREMAQGLRRTERRWLKDAGPRLRPDGLSSLAPDSALRAVQVYRLLISKT
jgi:hypothetical protein